MDGLKASGLFLYYFSVLSSFLTFKASHFLHLKNVHNFAVKSSLKLVRHVN